jgi:putative endonuclease
MGKKKKGPFYVYIVQCRDGTLYTGYTNDLEHRLKKHNSGQGAKYTRGRRPVKLVYRQKHILLGNALRAEIKIKLLTRKEKKELIKAYTINTRGKIC